MNKMRDEFFNHLTEEDLESFRRLNREQLGNSEEVFYSLMKMGKEPARIIMILMHELKLSLIEARYLYDTAWFKQQK